MSSLSPAAPQRHDSEPVVEHGVIADYTARSAFAAALASRIAVVASRGSGPVVATRLRRCLALSRLGQRLRRASDGEWVLKGTYALELRRPGAGWPGSRAWLAWHGSADSAAAAILDATRTDLGDFFEFDMRGASWPSRGGRIVGFELDSRVGDTAFERLPIDIRCAPEASWTAETVRAPDLLDFADLTPAELPALSLEDHFAERLVAYAPPIARPRSGSRPELLLEMALLCSSFPLSAERLAVAIRSAFERTRGHGPPGRLPPPPGEWLTSRRSVPGLAGESQPGRWYARVALLIDPVLAGARRDGRWDPVALRWATPQ